MGTFGFLAVVLTSAGWIPQVRKSVRTRSVKDFSWAYLGSFGTGLACWLVYGFGGKDVAIITANAWALGAVMVLAVIKRRSDGLAGGDQAGVTPDSADAGGLELSKGDSSASSVEDAQGSLGRWARSGACAAAAALVASLALAGVLHWQDIAHAGKYTISLSAGLATLVIGLATITVALRSEESSPTKGVPYNEIRQQVEHEDNLINHRMSWLMTSQAFMFAAAALRYASKSPSDAIVFQVIPAVAIVSAACLYVSLASAVAALERLRIAGASTPVDEAHPHLTVASGRWMVAGGLLSPLGMPVVFVTVWTLILVSGKPA
ncbi:MAG: hypothetical protein JWO77_3247 [Ilumatobacteraceae bacterium]|nr:hypothetical protein [Ilumatobacteraceae bacterium]